MFIRDMPIFSPERILRVHKVYYRKSSVGKVIVGLKGFDARTN
jgi:hypothetical protein